MALYTEKDIKELVAEHWEWIKDTAYPQDQAGELADSAVPIWTAEIQTTWCELDFEHQNTYKEQGVDVLPDEIETLMKYDLYYYYWQLYSSAIAELEKQAEQEQV
jgi:hypothetical protein